MFTYLEIYEIFKLMIVVKFQMLLCLLVQCSFTVLEKASGGYLPPLCASLYLHLFFYLHTYMKKKINATANLIVFGSMN